MDFWKIIKKILTGLALFVAIFIATTFALSYFFKDEIINFFIKESNKHINTPVDVARIDISVLSHFPNISIELNQVTVKENHNKNSGVLGKARQISLSFSPFDIVSKNYILKGLHIEDGEINLKIDKNGKANYLIIKKDTSTNAKTAFQFESLTATNVKVDYDDRKSDVHVALYVKEVDAALEQNNDLISIALAGDLVSDEIKVRERIFLNNKVVSVDTEFEIDMPSRRYEFKTGNLQIDQGQFEITGTVAVAEKDIDLKFKGVKTNFQTINSLLSSDLSKYLKEYRSRGNVYFSGSVSGLYDGNNKPRTEIFFGANNARFYHPEYKKQIKDVNLKGHFTTGKLNKPATYKLELKNFSCNLEEKQLEGSLVIQDFKRYHTDLVLRGGLDVNTVVMLFPENYVKTAFGSIDIDVHLNGRIKDADLTKSLKADGDISFHNVSFVLTGKKLPFNKINGDLSLRNNDLAISNLSGMVGSSDFRLNGFFKKISNLIINKKGKLKMQADLQSNYIDFDELLKSNFASRDTTGQKKKYEFRISPKIDLDFNCNIDKLRFQRFEGSNINGQLLIRDQLAVLKNVAFSSMGGRINISGSVSARDENLVETIAEANLDNISIDSIFYVFKNFNQTWLVDKNLKGQIYADLNLYMNFNKNLILNSNSLIADINTSISNGELNNFEPMMKLSDFVEEQSLANMRFSRMTNQIRIEQRTIYLPQMEIRSNVSNILISGTHTFDHEIDYHLSVPLRSFVSIMKKTGYNESARNGMNLLLKITGTTKDYEITFDSKAWKENVKRELFDEKKEWKNIKKPKEEETPELEEEYFDFDDGGN